MASGAHRRAERVRVTGIVQGVGFRPYVLRLARDCGVQGSVQNNTDGVVIEVEGEIESVRRFLTRLPREAPAAAEISELYSAEIAPQGYAEFTIRASAEGSAEITAVSPDIAVCPDCLAEMATQAHRREYPFITCTNCGPRFSIITEVPYDRPNTTMNAFEMCPTCAAEYRDPVDRRFHAQPIACRACGPRYSALVIGARFGARPGTGGGAAADPRSVAGRPTPRREHDLGAILQLMVETIAAGGICALKGIGGYHLICDAEAEGPVARLRDWKRRAGKPFAVMMPDTETVEQYCGALEHASRRLLESPARPIVLLEDHKRRVAAGVTNGFSTLGAMLPSMPLHYQLHRRLRSALGARAIVCTSGNRGDEPIVIEDQEAEQVLGAVAELIVGYDRRIHNRVDDSVVIPRGEQGPLFIRRARGYVPAPIRTALDAAGILAVGPQMKATVALGTGREVVLSQHLGELDNPETMEFFEEVIERFTRLFRFSAGTVAHDMHPDYLSTRFATEYAAARDIPTVAVQHHHAHIAACMAEHALDGPVIGLSLDGTGYGPDGAIWGGEVLVADLAAFERVYHLEYLPLPGGEAAIREPWRIALAQLHHAFGGLDAPELAALELTRFVSEAQRAAVTTAIERGINAPLSSSAGRLCDGVAALLGLCRRAAFDAEGPMRLEDLARRAGSRGASDRGLLHRDLGPYPFTLRDGVIELGELIRAIVADLLERENPSLLARRFHATLVEILVSASLSLRVDRGLRTVCLSGGVFQNRVMLDSARRRLEEEGFTVYTHTKVPPNDGGVALGQVAVAAARR